MMNGENVMRLKYNRRLIWMDLVEDVDNMVCIVFM